MRDNESIDSGAKPSVASRLQGIDYTQYFALGTDKTHTNPKGAETIAGFVRDALRAESIPLSANLR